MQAPLRARAGARMHAGLRSWGPGGRMEGKGLGLRSEAGAWEGQWML